jgi:hypothetical protein
LPDTKKVFGGAEAVLAPTARSEILKEDTVTEDTIRLRTVHMDDDGKPLCRQMNVRGTGYGGARTQDSARVTCKKCLKRLEAASMGRHA